MSVLGKRKCLDSKSVLPSKKPKNLIKDQLLESRKKLPIWDRRQDIRDALRDHDVLVLSGETGSGKSTQVPQFLLESSWCSGMIGVTQPRRVAAISLAKRVAQEKGSPLGSSSPASTVGYSVRFDENTSPSTRIKFLTEGMLLQEMLRNPLLSKYSCIIVDEVHERSVNVDLIVGLLRELLNNPKRKSQLKVVVMSATADVQVLSQYFASPLASHVRPDSALLDEHTDERTEGVPGSRVGLCHIEGRQHPVKTHYLSQPTNNVFDAVKTRIFQIHCREPLPGDILVFLTGQEAIRTLQKIIEELAESLPADIPKILVLPLFAALPQISQQQIFDKAPPFTRKVIMATNIAETSVTVPGVRFVVDTGKVKVRQFNHRLCRRSLPIQTVSKSSAEQRRGRAGREAPGQCFRLYTETTHNEFKKDTKPEMLRCDLISALLVMIARGVKDVFAFPYLTPPSQEAIAKTMDRLYWLGTIDKLGRITAMGKKVARLPLPPALGRVVYEAAKPERNCLLEVIDIVSCLSVENIYLNTDAEEAREEAETARSQLFRRQGDHLTFLAVVRGYAAEQFDRRRWANDHFISHSAMKKVMDVRKQLTSHCKQSLEIEPTVREDDEETQERILKCFLVAHGNYTAGLQQDKKTYKTNLGNHTVAIHPSSVLFGKKVEAIMYTELEVVQSGSGQLYARGVSAVQVKWLVELFGQQNGALS